MKRCPKCGQEIYIATITPAWGNSGADIIRGEPYNGSCYHIWLESNGKIIDFIFSNETSSSISQISASS